MNYTGVYVLKSATHKTETVLIKMSAQTIIFTLIALTVGFYKNFAMCQLNYIIALAYIVL